MDIFVLMTFFVALASSVLSGLAHGGGGFIMGPYWLLAGMTPLQGATTGAFTSIGMTLSSSAAFKKAGYRFKGSRLATALAAMSIATATGGALILPHIDPAAFRTTLALVTLFAIPLLFVHPSRTAAFAKYKRSGMLLACALLAIGSVISSSAFSILFTLVLMNFFGMSVLRASALRRTIGIGQSITLFMLLAAQGGFLWQHGFMALAGATVGSYVGTRFAIKKGETFAKYTVAVMSLLGATALLIA